MRWIDYEQRLKYLDNLEISHKVMIDKPILIELRSFSDASQ